jgi:hypothetical protein
MNRYGFVVNPYGIINESRQQELSAILFSQMVHPASIEN